MYSMLKPGSSCGTSVGSTSVGSTSIGSSNGETTTKPKIIGMTMRIANWNTMIF